MSLASVQVLKPINKSSYPKAKMEELLFNADNSPTKNVNWFMDFVPIFFVSTSVGGRLSKGRMRGDQIAKLTRFK